MASDGSGDPRPHENDDSHIYRPGEDDDVGAERRSSSPSVSPLQGGDPPSPSSLTGPALPYSSSEAAAVAATSDPESQVSHDIISPTLEESRGVHEAAQGAATENHIPDAALLGSHEPSPLVDAAERIVDVDHGPSPTSHPPPPPPQPPTIDLEQHLEQSASASAPSSSSTSSPPTRRRRSPPARMASQESQDSWATTNTASSLSQLTSALQPPQPDTAARQPTQWYSSVSELFQSTLQQQSSSSSSTEVPLSQLRKLASQGGLDASHRGVSWRVLLHYLGTDRLMWSHQLEQKRHSYANYLRILFVHPMDVGSELKQQPRRRRSCRSASSDDEADEYDNENDASTTVPPVPSAESNDSSSSTILLTEDATHLPSIVVDAWKRSGRDYHILASVTSGRNALRWPPGNIDGTWVDGETDDAASIDHFVRTAALLDEIRKDVNRTGCDLAFYLDPALGKRRHSALERILLVWSVMAHADPTTFAHPEGSDSGLNRPTSTATRYVQGMNEIAAVLYFVLTALEEDDDTDELEEDRGGSDHDVDSNEEGHRDDKQEADGAVDPNENDDSDQGDGAAADLLAGRATECDADWADHAEPDAYWLFHALLAEMGDVFAPDLDGSATGIQGRIDAMRQLLHRHDAETSEHLQELGIDTSFYAVRWWTTLLSREFLLPDTIRLWDSMFASTHKDNFIRYVCVTMVLLVRDDLLKGDFSACLRLLQKFPPTNMEQLLQSSRALYVYDSQITVACHRGKISLSQALQTIAPPPGIVFAFGLRNGLMMRMTEPEQPPPSDSLSVAESTSWGAIAASGSTEQKVREATQAVASQAQVFLGRAVGFYRRYRTSSNNINTTGASSDRCDSTGSLHNSDSIVESPSSGGADDAPPSAGNSDSAAASGPELPPDHPDDSIYLEAILKA